MTKETKEIESVYLYVHSFKWLNKKDEKHFKGHLKEGRVYKAQTEPFGDKTLYKIELLPTGDKPTGIALLELSGKFDSWECEIQLVEDEDLLDLIITDDDMEMIASDASQYMGETDNLDNFSEDEVELILVSDSLSAKLTEQIENLRKLDPEMVKFLMMLIQGTTDILQDKDYITMTGHLSVRGDKTGRIANMTLAAAHLEAHLNSSSNNPANLMNAIFTILLELKRTVNIS